MLDPPWALPPAPDINPPCRGLDYALGAVDASRKPLSLAALTGFNIAIAYAPNSNSQIVLQARQAGMFDFITLHQSKVHHLR